MSKIFSYSFLLPAPQNRCTQSKKLIDNVSDRLLGGSGPMQQWRGQKAMATPLFCWKKNCLTKRLFCFWKSAILGGGGFQWGNPSLPSRKFWLMFATQKSKTNINLASQTLALSLWSKKASIRMHLGYFNDIRIHPVFLFNMAHYS